MDRRMGRAAPSRVLVEDSMLQHDHRHSFEFVGDTHEDFRIEGSLFLPFEVSHSPHFEHLGEANTEWLIRFGLISSGSKFHLALQRSQFDRLAAMVYAEGDREVIELCTNYISSLFVFDDIVDNARSAISSDASLLRHVVDFLGASITGKAPPPLDEGIPGRGIIEALGDAFADIGNRLVRRSSPESMQHFVGHFRSYLAGCIEESRWLERTIRDVSEYFSIRSSCSGVHSCVDIGFLARGLSLSARTRSNPNFLRMMRSTALCVACTNDLFSYRRDLKDGISTNIVLLHERLYGVSTQKALAMSVHELDRIAADFIQSKRALESGRVVDPALPQYIAQMEMWMRGNFEWYNQSLTERYTANLYMAEIR